MAAFTPAVGPDTAILPLLNGIRHLDALQARFGAAHALGGQCLISTTLDAEGKRISRRSGRSVRATKLGSHWTRRWRGESTANSSLKWASGAWRIKRDSRGFMDDFRSVRALFWALISRNCVLSRRQLLLRFWS